MRYFAHIYTCEDYAWHPEIVILGGNYQTVAEYPLSDEDTLRSALDALWYDHGWRVRTDTAYNNTAVEPGYDIVEVGRVECSWDGTTQRVSSPQPTSLIPRSEKDRE